MWEHQVLCELNTGMHCSPWKITRHLIPFCIQVHLTWGVASPPAHIVEQVISHISLLTAIGESNYSHLGYAIPSHLVENRVSHTPLRGKDALCLCTLHDTCIDVRQTSEEWASGTHGLGGWLVLAGNPDTLERRKISCHCRELNLESSAF
jgi:hypothetical protein